MWPWQWYIPTCYFFDQQDKMPQFFGPTDTDSKIFDQQTHSQCPDRRCSNICAWMAWVLVWESWDCCCQAAGLHHHPVLTSSTSYRLIWNVSSNATILSMKLLLSNKGSKDRTRLCYNFKLVFVWLLKLLLKLHLTVFSNFSLVWINLTDKGQYNWPPGGSDPTSGWDAVSPLSNLYTPLY